MRPKRNYTKKPLDRLKRPRNGYMIYMNEVYDDVKRKHPNLKFGELSSLIGVQWKEMSKAQQMVITLYIHNIHTYIHIYIHTYIYIYIYIFF
jgi:hypothetical protein